MKQVTLNHPTFEHITVEVPSSAVADWRAQGWVTKSTAAETAAGEGQQNQEGNES